jgi:hypothetical protein
MSNVNKLISESSDYQVVKESNDKLISKWDRTGLLEGMETDFKKSGMARLLENQAAQLLKEGPSVSSPSGGSVGTGYKGDEEWSGVALPLVRRIFAEIAAQDFVSVQPMNLPSGLVFYLEFQHGTATGPFTNGGNVFGNTGEFSPSGAAAPYGEDSGFYGAGRYGYSISQSIANGATTTAGTLPSLQDINFDMELSASSNGKLYLVKTDAVTLSSSYDDQAIRAFDFAFKADLGADAVTSATVLKRFTKVDADNKINLIVSASGALTASSVVSVGFYKQNTEASRGDFEDTKGNAADTETLNIPEIKIQLQSRPIVAKHVS